MRRSNDMNEFFRSIEEHKKQKGWPENVVWPDEEE